MTLSPSRISVLLCLDSFLQSEVVNLMLQLLLLCHAFLVFQVEVHLNVFDLRSLVSHIRDLTE